MRRILLIALSVIIIVLFGFVVAKGFKIGGFTVLGVAQIKEKNDSLNLKNEKLSKLIDTDYNKAISDVKNSETSLQTKKDEYNSQIALSADNGNGYLATTEKYEIEFLWTRLGNHAKDHGVIMKIELTESNTSGYYKLNFTITGPYVGITDFIYSIENDSKLGFKIDNFAMSSNGETTSSSNSTVSSQAGEVKATFSCDEIAINIETIDQGNINNSTDSSYTNDTTNSTNTTNTTSGNTSANNTSSNVFEQY